MRGDFIKMPQVSFEKFYRQYEGVKTNNDQLDMEKDIEDFDFRAFQKCYLLLKINRWWQVLIYTMVYWWPIALIEHLIILANCIILGFYKQDISINLLRSIVYLNIVLSGYLILISILRLVLIKSAGKSIKHEYFIYIDLFVGLIAALELLMSFHNHNHFLPASILMLMLMRFLLKIYCVSIDTSLR